MLSALKSTIWKVPFADSQVGCVTSPATGAAGTAGVSLITTESTASVSQVPFEAFKV